MNLMVLPLWAWIVFYVLVFFMLVADLKMSAIVRPNLTSSIQRAMAFASPAS